MNRLKTFLEEAELASSFLAGVFGLIFGTGLVLSGMVNPAKVKGFLNLTGVWDPSLLLVLGGAILAAAPFMYLAEKRGRTLLNNAVISLPSRKGVDRKLIAGSAIFGLGWGLSGLCPGAVLAGLGLLHPVLWAFFASMLLGMWSFEKVKVPLKI